MGSDTSYKFGSAALLFILVLILAGTIILYILGFFYVGGGGYGTTVLTGFDMIRPMGESVEYKNRSFTASFRNTLDNPVKIKNITLNESPGGAQCMTGTPGNPLPGDYIGPGSTFNITAMCQVMEDGESYNLEICVQYAVLIDGKETEYTETGRIMGQGEPYKDY